ncbi:MAG: hypothetical protein KGL10_03905 [Alphaproteobacteria bacterium]|nr:hypothetical protein [Alphaproteobacteria bacterium]
MTQATPETQTQQVHLTRDGDVTIVTLGRHKVEINAAAKTVTACTDQDVEVSAVPVSAPEGAPVSISRDFNTVVLNGVSIGQAGNGRLVISPAGNTVIIGKPAAAQDTAAAAAAAEKAVPASAEAAAISALTIGAQAEDGWIYVGRSVQDGKPMYAMPANAGCMDFKDAAEAAARLKASGKTNCRIPTIRELTQIFNNAQNLPGLPQGSYWSSTRTLFGKSVKTGKIARNTSIWNIASHCVHVSEEKMTGKGHTALFVRS